MKQEEYRAQVDAVSFSPDFQDRTMARLKELAQEKEKKPMKKAHWRTGLMAAAAAAVLVTAALAAEVMGFDFVRVFGKPILGMCVTGIGAVTNIVLDAVFIIIFDWGVVGAAS